MTREEKIEILEKEKAYMLAHGGDRQAEALTSAIKALQQDTCEDSISRQAALDITWEEPSYTDPLNVLTEVRDKVKDLPSVNPQEPKTGHWIMKHRTHNEIKHYTGQDEMGETHTISVLERYEADEPYCSECGKRAGDTSQNYCCACGAKMIDPQESEN